MREAGREIGIDYTGIVKTCSGKQVSTGGYFWYKEAEFDEAFIERDMKKYQETMRYRKK